MTALLLFIAAIIVATFILGLAAAIFSHMSGRTARLERAQAALMLSRISPDSRGVLLRVYAAFKSAHILEANREVATHEPEIHELRQALARPRAPISSAGRFGDALDLTVWEQELHDRGYTEQTAGLIASVLHHHLDDALSAPFLEARGHPQTLSGHAQQSVAPGAVSGDDGQTGLDNGGESQEDGDWEEQQDEDEEGVEEEPIPEWLEKMAWDAPVKIRQGMKDLGVRIVRHYPHVRSFSEWDDFERIATVAGCAAVALRLRIEMPPWFQGPLHEVMRDSLDVVFPNIETLYGICMAAAEEALIGVDRTRRSQVASKFLSQWVFDFLGEKDRDDADAELIAVLAGAYRLRAVGYWSRGPMGDR